MLQKIQLALSVGLAIITCLSYAPDEALSQDPYYKGKTLTIIQSRRPGGTGDMRVRAIVPLLKKHISGHPNIVMRYMPGAGGAKASNHLYRAARPNGLTIANTSVGMTVQGVVGAPGVRYDLKKLSTLGLPIAPTFQCL
jgi:tripartite-type tricarboxylate transporter receptor subunit TctC